MEVLKPKENLESISERETTETAVTTADLWNEQAIMPFKIGSKNKVKDSNVLIIGKSKTATSAQKYFNIHKFLNPELEYQAVNGIESAISHILKNKPNLIICDHEYSSNEDSLATKLIKYFQNNTTDNKDYIPLIVISEDQNFVESTDDIFKQERDFLMSYQKFLGIIPGYKRTIKTSDKASYTPLISDYLKKFTENEAKQTYTTPKNKQTTKTNGTGL